MATSPSHQLGEFIGDFFEFSIIEYLRPIVSQKGYYLDYRHPRPARGNKREVIGVDLNGNKHKLDIVIEEGGSEAVFGRYKAYIEMAWRRYVKHSKNKVQEIAGAILPLVETNAQEKPFYAAVLAGEFTDNALTQLRSQGFYVLYFKYHEICKLFDTIGLSIRWEEDTSEADIRKIANKFDKPTQAQLQQLRCNFYAMYKTQLDGLAIELCKSLVATVSEVIVIPLHGTAQILRDANSAVKYILSYDESRTEPIFRYEIIVRYNNGDEFTMKCSDKTKAIQFLNQYK